VCFLLVSMPWPRRLERGASAPVGGVNACGPTQTLMERMGQEPRMFSSQRRGVF